MTVSGVTIRYGVEDSTADRTVIFPILPGGIVTIRQETASQNSAASGAGIQNWGNLIVASSTLNDNHASRNGGGFDIGRA